MERTLSAEETKMVTEHFRLFKKASQSLFKKYDAAIREMKTRFEILDADLEYRFNRNPIHHMETRLKSPESVFEKMQRYGLPVTLKSMESNILDVAGMRVIVSYIDDVYAMVKVLSMQDDLKIVKVKDYIADPKPNGYRSLHVIVKVPVYFLDRKQYVPVEIQFRTIAMDFWASLEHTLKYKQDVHLDGIDMYDELKDCSDIIEDVERRMQILMHAVQTTDVEEAARKRRRQLEEQEARVAQVQNAQSGSEQDQSSVRVVDKAN
ncbi:MAG: (p)ppGpp synthetase [Eggerthellaceae bacterium]